VLSIFGKKNDGYCDGLSRRSFLKIGAFGSALTLADMLRLRASAAPGTRHKSVIMVYLGGGPSHMDMYDLKPNAPSEFRGEFNPIQTNVPGVQICEHFPMQARMWDKLACVRSLVTVNEHSDTMVMTGHSDREAQTRNYPSFGSVVSHVRSNMVVDMPAFVSLRGMSRGTEPGFLGVQHRPFSPNGPGVENLRPLNMVNNDRQSQRRNMLETFDSVREEIDTTGQLAGLDTFTQRAFEMISSGGVRAALDSTSESTATRERYRGVEGFLTARRLVEAGVSCVTLSFGGWDTHSNNFRTLSQQLPRVDRGLANLVSDLHERGLGDDVITVMWGEFGRTPRINRTAGRDHWPAAASCFIAGGGLRMGQAVGATNARGESPVEGRCTPSNVLATIYTAMGINPAQTINDNTGRPRYILDNRAVVQDLL